MYYVKTISLFVFILFVTAGSVIANDRPFNAYGQEDVKFIVRGRLGYSLPDYNVEFKQDGTKATRNSDDFFTSTFSFEAEGQYRVTDHFSVGAALGYIAKTEEQWQSESLVDNGSMDLIPITALIQFMPAPYGEVRPYIGLGYHYSFIKSNFENIDVDIASGLVAQLGVDWWMAPNWGVNLDIKKFYMETEVDLTTLSNGLKADATIDPLLISGGVSYRF